jgi:hypothetical protein
MNSIYVALPEQFRILYSGKMYRALLKLTVGKTLNFVEGKSVIPSKNQDKSPRPVVVQCALYFAEWNVTYKI